jgi:HPt (histidine-containing phosphotransfer) domain-containing protein
VEVFDRVGALDRLGGDVDRLQDLLEDFQIKIPAMMKAMENAADRKRSARLEELGGELRDAAHSIGAEGMENLAEQIGDAARSEDYEKIVALLTHMGMELEWLLRILDENRCSGNL